MKSAQISLIAIALAERMGHGQAQIVPPVDPRSDDPAAAISSGMATAKHLGFFLLNLAAQLDLRTIHGVYRQKDPHR